MALFSFLSQLFRASPADSAKNSEMTFLEHLEELRQVLTKSLLAYLFATILVAAGITYLTDFLYWPLEQALDRNVLEKEGLILTSPMAIFTLMIQIVLFGGFALALPFMLYFLIQFIAPALTPQERRLLRPVCLSILALFLLGCGFSFFLLVPAALSAAHQLSTAFGFKTLWTADAYFNLVVWMTFGVGLTFEFPLLLLLLVKLGILRGSQLLSLWQYALVFFLVLSALITPTSDPLTFVILAIPLYVLYLLTALFAHRMQSRAENLEEA